MKSIEKFFLVLFIFIGFPEG